MLFILLVIIWIILLVIALYLLWVRNFFKRHNHEAELQKIKRLVLNGKKR